MGSEGLWTATHFALEKMGDCVWKIILFAFVSDFLHGLINKYIHILDTASYARLVPADDP
jgi:hypothetical protein